MGRYAYFCNGLIKIAEEMKPRLTEERRPEPAHIGNVWIGDLVLCRYQKIMIHFICFLSITFSLIFVVFKRYVKFLSYKVRGFLFFVFAFS